MEYVSVSRLTEDQVDDLLELYRNTYWAGKRQKDDVIRMLAGTDLVFGICELDSGRLRAFARVLSDGVYRAVLFDVIVHPDHQGMGLARRLLDEVTSHPELKDVENLLLYCTSDVVKLYNQWGFSDELGDTRLMKRISE